MYRLSAVAAISLLLSACASTPQQTTAAPVAAPASAPVKTEPQKPVETEAQRQQRLMNELSAKSIFFSSGSVAVEPEYQALVQQVYEFLAAAPQVSITLAGNSDERGGGSRSMALKRAESVKHALEQLGLTAKRIEVVSNGKDKPRAACHEEKCWAQNRRVDLVFHGAGAAP